MTPKLDRLKTITMAGLLTTAVFVEPACSTRQTPRETTPGVGSAPAPSGVPRLRFNQLALRLNLPLFWAADQNSNGSPDPDEVRSLLFYPTDEQWVVEGAFTPAFERVHQLILAAAQETAPADERRRLLRQELENTAPTLVSSDLGELPPEHRAFAQRMLGIAGLIDQLYARQVGMSPLADRVSGQEPESQSVFRRNWGTHCKGPTTESQQACSAIAGAPRQPVGVYPAAPQENDEFCQWLEALPNSSELLAPFTVVRQQEQTLNALAFTEVYQDQMSRVASELRAAAEALTDPNEAALRAYLRAAAQAFEDNNWEPADEAWAAMNAGNSRWYLRVAPDEVYWDPCSHKAGFHLTLSLINRDSLVWQDRLTPLQGDMEAALAALSEAYQPRDVAFHMPDFIDIVINAGDDRKSFGATIGQSLPNWGRVAQEGRGRTVVMSNLYADSDSVARSRERAASMFSAASMELFSDTPEPGLVNTILHEAAHNLGPSHEFRVEGRTDDEIFGGGLASMLEELKAQTSNLFLLDFLRQRQVLDERQQHQAILHALIWATGHISRGMYTPSGQRKPYSQLAAIQVGFLMERGALRYDAQGQAANGQDLGAFTIDFDVFPGAAEELMGVVMEIKARGDRPRAEELASRFVDGSVVPQQMIVERARRFPQATLVYSLSL